MDSRAPEAEASRTERPGVVTMIRAAFLSSIAAPLAVGTLLAVIVRGSFDLVGCVLAVLMGAGLHVATNVYNDIYDHLQGNDGINDNRNDFSGGSGVLQQFPDLLPRMYLLARGGVVLGLCATIGFHFRLETPLREIMWGLFALSAFFSKYYTAGPVKLASRGLGEVSVWFAFGPMATAMAVVSQGVWLDEPIILVALPITGFSTLSILLFGQLLDIHADRASGKLGVAARGGTKLTAALCLTAHLLTVVNSVVLAFLLPVSWPLALSVIPFAALLPKIWVDLSRHHADPKALIPTAGRNVQLHLGFSILIAASLALVLGLEKLGG